MCPQTLARKGTGLTKLFGIPAMNDGFQYLFSERDCLNLGIYVPVLEAPPPVGGIPVIVFIHGGNLRHGGNAHPVYGKTQSSFGDKPALFSWFLSIPC